MAVKTQVIDGNGAVVNPAGQQSDPAAWRPYAGGGATNSNLQVAANQTALAALGTAPADIALAASVNSLAVWLMNTTAGQGGLLCVGQFDADGNLLRIDEPTVAAADQTFATDQKAWGVPALTAGTDKKAKPPVVPTFRRHAATAKLRLWMSQSDGGVWHARYQLYGSA